MKQNYYTLAFCILCAFSYAQDYAASFHKYFQEGDTIKQIEILRSWQGADPDNPELYTSFFNYYIQRSRHEVLAITQEMPSGDGFSIQDSLGNTAGYLGNSVYYEPELFQKGLRLIDEGIEKFPDRLDMRFGKIYILGEVNDWQLFTEEILKAIRHSSKNENLWKWTNDEEIKGGKNIFLSSIQDYQQELFNTGDDSLLTNMRSIAQEVLKNYPDHIESLTNLSITYLLSGEYQKGLDVLLRAEKIDPQDPIVLANIAHGYKLNGQKDLAIIYYQKLMDMGEGDAADFAKKEIEALKE